MKKMIGAGVVVLLLAFAGFQSCDPVRIEAGFEDLLQLTIYDYMIEDSLNYSSFLSILEAGGIDKTLSAYNPDGDGYTLFLPDNAAIDEFIAATDQYSNLQDLLNDNEYINTFSRYHVVNMSIRSDDFPFGALPEYTLSRDILTVSFVIEPDTSYYKINNQAPVIETNIEVSNGYVHLIKSALIPVSGTTFDWLELRDDYSIFKAALEATGLTPLLDVNTKEDEDADAVTLLLEHDDVFAGRDIHSFEDLAAWISPGEDNFIDPTNPLYGFVAYHILEGNNFLDDFAEVTSNYTTYSEVPVLINGNGLDITINDGKEIFDTLVVDQDTTIIDFIGFDYDNSNVLTQSGAIHFIDQVLRQQVPSTAEQNFEFWDEPLLNEYRETPGEYLIEDTSALNNFTWSGTDLYFIETGDDEHPAWGGDYLFMDGDFTISYQLPKLVQGIYSVLIRAETLASDNALVEVFIDGKSVGGLVDLSAGGNENYPFEMVELGTINLLKYEEHTVEITSLIPGKFSWDLIRFEPYVKE